MQKAQDIMTRAPKTVTPNVSVNELAKLLWENRLNGVPVVDTEGNLLGVVTESDLIDQTKKVHIPTVFNLLDSMIFLENPQKVDKELKKMAGTTVEDIYTKEVTCVKPDTPLDEIASIMSERKFHTIPVVADGDKLVGVIGKSDIIKTLAQS